MDWSNQEIEQAAHQFIAVRGDEAEARAHDRAGDLARQGAKELAAVWERIAVAIARLQGESPHDG